MQSKFEIVFLLFIAYFQLAGTTQREVNVSQDHACPYGQFSPRRLRWNHRLHGIGYIADIDALGLKRNDQYSELISSCRLYV